MSGLVIKKLGYSRNPWRLELDGEEFRIDGHPFFSWERKRDAKPYFKKLLSIGDWSGWREFSDEQWQQVAELARQTEGYKQLVQIEQRQRTTPWWA